MKQIKVFSGYCKDMQQKIDMWVDENPDIAILDIKNGGLNNHGYAICYIIYEKVISYMKKE